VAFFFAPPCKHLETELAMGRILLTHELGGLANSWPTWSMTRR